MQLEVPPGVRRSHSLRLSRAGDTRWRCCWRGCCCRSRGRPSGLATSPPKPRRWTRRGAVRGDFHGCTSPTLCRSHSGSGRPLLGGDTESARGTHHLQEAPTAAEGAPSQRRPRPLPRTSESQYNHLEAMGPECGEVTAGRRQDDAVRWELRGPHTARVLSTTPCYRRRVRVRVKVRV